MQLTGSCATTDGAKHDYNAVYAISLVEEDGELKVLEVNEFADSRARNHIWSSTRERKGRTPMHQY